MADTPAADPFRDPAFVEAFETLTRNVLGDIIDNANPRPSTADSHNQLREFITRIIHEEAVKAPKAGEAAIATGTSSDLDRSGAPRVTEPAADLALAPADQRPGEQAEPPALN